MSDIPRLQSKDIKRMVKIRKIQDKHQRELSAKLAAADQKIIKIKYNIAKSTEELEDYETEKYDPVELKLYDVNYTIRSTKLELEQTKQLPVTAKTTRRIKKLENDLTKLDKRHTTIQDSNDACENKMEDMKRKIKNLQFDMKQAIVERDEAYKNRYMRTIEEVFGQPEPHLISVTDDEDDGLEDIDEEDDDLEDDKEDDKEDIDEEESEL